MKHNIFKNLFVLFILISIICTFTVSSYATEEVIRHNIKELQDGAFSTSTSNSSLFFEKMFSAPDYTSEDVENVCNYIIGRTYVSNELIKEVQECGTLANMIIEYEYNSYSSKRTAIPDYLELAKNKLDGIKNSTELNRSASSSYLMSSSNRFKIMTYNVDYNYEKMNFIANVFEGIYSYYCSIYDFEEPTTNGEYMEVYIEDTNSYGGAAYPLENGRSKIHIQHIAITNAINHSNMCVIGIAAHEYMHAILYQYGIESSIDLNHGWFHESMCRAAGAEYEETYANWDTVCSDIQSFMNILNTTISSHTGNNVIESAIRDGACLFNLFLYDYYDEWTTIRYMLEEYSTSNDLIDMIENMLLNKYNDSLENAFRYFMLYNASPDDTYSMSPKNKMSTGYHTWGAPPLAYSYTMSMNNSPYIGSGTVIPSAANYVKLSIPSTSTGAVNVSISRTLTNCTTYYIHTVYHNSVTDVYTFSNAILGNPGTKEIDIDVNNVDVIYLIIVNPNEVGNVAYSFSAELNP